MGISSSKKEKADKVYFRINQDLNLHRLGMARAQLDRLRKMEGDTARVNDLRGMFAVIDGDYKEAEKFHEKAIEMDPRSKRFRLNLGNLYMITESWKKAAETFKSITEDDPEYFPALNNLSMALFKMDKKDEAIKYINMMKQIKPTSPAPHRLETLYYYQKGELEKALAAADQNISLDPENPLTFITLGQIFNEMERYEDAVTAYEKARQLDPTDMDNKLNLALIYGNIDRFDLALPLLEEVVEKEPENGLAHRGLALIYKLYGKEELFKKHAQLAKKYGHEVEIPKRED